MYYIYRPGDPSFPAKYNREAMLRWYEGDVCVFLALPET